MAKIPTRLRKDKTLDEEGEKLQNKLDDVYTEVTTYINRKVDLIIQDRAPTDDDDKVDLGSLWLNRLTRNKYMFTSLTTTPKWTAF